MSVVALLIAALAAWLLLVDVFLAFWLITGIRRCERERTRLEQATADYEEASRRLREVPVPDVRPRRNLRVVPWGDGA